MTTHHPSHATLHIAGLDTARLVVERASGHEAVSKLYRFDVDLRTDLDDDEIDALLGTRARLALYHGEHERRFHGIVCAVETRSDHRVALELRRRIRVRIVPRAWLLGQRRNTRIFRDVSAGEVVGQVCAEHGVPTRFELRRQLPRRPYQTQYEETDVAFVRRIAAENGLAFRFDQPSSADLGAPSLPAFPASAAAIPGVADAIGLVEGMVQDEVLVFSDDAVFAPGLDATITELAGVAVRLGGLAVSGPDLGAAFDAGVDRLGAALAEVASALLPAPTLRLASDTGALRGDVNLTIAELSARRAIRPTSAAYRDFDPRRPHFPIVGRAGVGVAGTALATAGNAIEAMTGRDVDRVASHLQRAFGPDACGEVYEHHGTLALPETSDGPAEAERVLGAARRDARVARGRSSNIRLQAGRRFALEDHPEDAQNRTHIVIEVRHRFRGDEVGTAGASVYENRFRCVPANVHFAPARPARRVVQSLLTAIVVAGGELEAAAMGEVRVRFHWDRAGAETCWLRCMQPCAGAGWGAQFLPRHGNEVVVGFEGGDPDKPLVLGSVYNAVNPTPFSIPEDRTRSGFRTRTLGGSGHNELSFDDAGEREQVFLRAQRNLDIEVHRDRTASVERDDYTTVRGDRHLRVEGLTRSHLGDEETHVARSRLLHVEGRATTVAHSIGERVEGDVHRHIGGRDLAEAGTSDLRAAHRARRLTDSSVERVGSETRPGAREVRVEGTQRTTSSGLNELGSQEEILLCCGESSIRITPSRIELTSPAFSLLTKGASLELGESELRASAEGLVQAIGSQALLRSSGASLALSSEAHLDGARVALCSPRSATDPVEERTIPVTTVVLEDDDGNPIPYQRYRLDLADGSSRVGTLDEHGRAQVRVEGEAEVSFPDLTETRLA